MNPSCVKLEQFWKRKLFYPVITDNSKQSINSDISRDSFSSMFVKNTIKINLKLLTIRKHDEPLHFYRPHKD